MEDRIRTLHYREPDVRPPLDIGDVIRTSYQLLFAHPWLTLGLGTLVVAPVSLREAFRPADVGPFAFMATSPAYAVAALADTFVAPALVGGVAALVAVASHTKRPVVAREILRRLASRLPRAIVATLLSTLAMIAGAAFCLVPGVIVAIATALVVCVVVIEDTGPFAALPRTAELTKGIRVRLIGVMFVAFLPSLAIYFMFRVFGDAEIVVHGFTSPAESAMAIVQALVKALCMTVMSLALGVVYARAAIVPSETHVAEVAAVFA